MYKGLEQAKKLKYNQMVICRCPNWCSLGYQVAYWNGEMFEYDDDPNGGFNDHVIAFMPLDEDGEPCALAG